MKTHVRAARLVSGAIFCDKLKFQDCYDLLTPNMDTILCLGRLLTMGNVLAH